MLLNNEKTYRQRRNHRSGIQLAFIQPATSRCLVPLFNVSEKLKKGYDLMLIDKCEKPEMLKRFHYSPKSLPGSKTIMT